MAALLMGGFSPWDHTLSVWMWSWWNWEKKLLVKVLRPGALGRPRGIGWRGRWEGGSEWGIHVYPWLIHVYLWQKPLQYCKIISLQLIKKKITCQAFSGSWSGVQALGTEMPRDAVSAFRLAVHPPWSQERVHHGKWWAGCWEQLHSSRPGEGVLRQIAQGSEAQPHGLEGDNWQLFQHLHPWEASLSVGQGLGAELGTTFIASCLVLHFVSLPHWRARNERKDWFKTLLPNRAECSSASDAVDWSRRRAGDEGEGDVYCRHCACTSSGATLNSALEPASSILP